MKTIVYDNQDSKSRRWHPERGVNTPVIAVVDVLVNCRQHLAGGVETVDVPQIPA